MTRLRKQMIKASLLLASYLLQHYHIPVGRAMHGFSPRTHESYLSSVYGLARYYHRSPDNLTATDLNRYFEYLVTERKLSAASCRLYFNGIRFLYMQVLHWSRLDLTIALPKRPQRIPELLNAEEVGRLLAAGSDVRYRMMFALCYGCVVVVVEGTQPDQIRAVALQGNPHPFGQALDGDVLLQAVDLVVRDAGHIRVPLKNVSRPFQDFFVVDFRVIRLYDYRTF